MDQTKQLFFFDKLDFSNVQVSNYINVVVGGFWSTPVSICIQRNTYDPIEESYWSFHVSHSSGGYNSNDLQATLNFAMANIAAVEYCKELQKDIPALEQAYQATHAAMIAKADEERKAREAVLAADPEVGLKCAKTMLNLMQSDIDSGKSPMITTTHRASDAVVNIIGTWDTGRLRFIVNKGRRRTLKDTADYLAQLSAKNVKYCRDIDE